MTAIRTITLVLCIGLLLAASFGCARSPSTYYYVLSSDQKIAAETPTPKAAVQLRRVDIPAYLDRNSIVTRSENTVQLNLAEFHQWAEGLNSGMRRVLAEVLAPRLAEQNVTLEPLDADESGPLQIFVQVLRFEGTFGENVLLDARWTLRTSHDSIVAQGTFVDTCPAGQSYENLVKAQSALLIRFGESLVPQIRKHSLAYAKAK